MSSVIASREEIALRQCMLELMGGIDFETLKDIIIYLEQEEYLTTDDRERILHEVTTRDKVSKFIDILRNHIRVSKNSDAYNSFLKALKDFKLDHLAKSLEHFRTNAKPGRRHVDSETDFGQILQDGGVPKAPPSLIGRDSLESDIRQKLLTLSQEPGWFLVHGMGGIGKTVLVTRALYHHSIIEKFIDGVHWVKVGKVDERYIIESKLRSLLASLDPKKEFRNPASIEEARTLLRQRLSKKQCLIILDDVWEQDTLREFDFNGRILVTSRNSVLLERIRGDKSTYEVNEGFNQDQARESFHLWTGVPVSNLPLEADEIIKLCRGSPLAISMLGSHLAKRKDRWRFYLEKLKKDGGLSSISNTTDYEYNTVNEAIGISIDDLDENTRNLYEHFAIFHEDAVLSVEVMSIFWNMDMQDEVIEKLDGLYSKSLCSREWNNSRECDLYGVHDLQLLVLTDRLNHIKKQDLHRKLVDNYEKRCSANWPRLLVSDTYIWWALGHHLHKAGMDVRLVELFTDLRFLEAKLKITGPSDVLNDLIKYKHVFVKLLKVDERKDMHRFIRLHAHKIVRAVRFKDSLTGGFGVGGGGTGGIESRNSSVGGGGRSRHLSRPGTASNRPMSPSGWLTGSITGSSSTNQLDFSFNAAAIEAEDDNDEDDDEEEFTTPMFPDLIQLGLCQPHTSTVFKSALKLAQQSRQLYWEWCNSEMASNPEVWVEQFSNAILSIDVSCDGNLVVVGDNKGSVFLLKSSTGDRLWEFNAFSDSPVNQCFFNSTGDSFVVTSDAPDSSENIKFYSIPEHFRTKWMESSLPFSNISSTGSEGTTPNLMSHTLDFLQPPISHVPDKSHKDNKPTAVLDKNITVTYCKLFEEDSCLLVGQLDGTISRYQLEAGRLFSSRDYPRHTQAIVALDVTHDNRFFVSASRDQSVRVYNLEDVEWVWEHIIEASDGLPTCACFFTFSPAKQSGGVNQSGPFVAFALGYSVYVYNITTKKKEKLFKGDNREGNIQAISLSKCGTFVATGSTNFKVELWLYEEGTLHTEFFGHSSLVTGVAFLPLHFYSTGNTSSSSSASITACVHDTRLLSGSDDGTVMLWDLKQSQSESLSPGLTAPLLYSTSSSISSSYSASGDCGSHHGDRRLSLKPEFEAWFLEDDSRLLVVGQERKSLHLKKDDEANSPELLFLCAASPNLDEFPHIGPDFDGNEEAEQNYMQANNCTAFAISVDGNWVATGYERGLIQLFHLNWEENRLTQALCTLSLPDWHSNGVHRIIFLPGSRYVVTMDTGGFVKLTDTQDKGVCCYTSTTKEGHPSAIQSARFMPRTSQLVSGDKDGWIVMWTVSAGPGLSIEGKWQAHIDAAVTDVYVDSEETRLATCSVDTFIKVWRISDKSLLFTLRGHDDCVRVVRFCPGRSDFLASGGDQENVRLWYLREASTDTPTTVDQIPLATQSSYRTVCLTSGRTTNNTNWVTSLIWSSDGRTLVSASDCLRSWRLESSDRNRVERSLYLRGHRVSRLRGSCGASTISRLVTVDTTGTLYILRKVDTKSAKGAGGGGTVPDLAGAVAALTIEGRGGGSTAGPGFSPVSY